MKQRGLEMKPWLMGNDRQAHGWSAALEVSWEAGRGWTFTLLWTHPCF